MNQEGGDMREFNHSRRNQYEKNSKERTRKKLRMATHTKQSNFKVRQKYARLHQELSRSEATQTSKINLVKDYELVQDQIKVLYKTIREIETRVMIACAKTE